MKKKLSVVLCVFLVALFMFSACSSAEPEVILTKEEVDLLREENKYKYLIYDYEPPQTVDYSEERLTFREYIMETDTFAYCEAIEEPEYVKSNFSSVMMRAHTVRVIMDSEGIFNEGDEITFYYGMVDQYQCPSPKVREKIIVPMTNSYPENPADVISSYYGYYYVTESGHVISAFEEDEDAAYSGQTVKNLLEILKKTDKEREEYLSEKIGMYERTGGKYGFTSLEMLREQIMEKRELRKEKLANKDN